MTVPAPMVTGYGPWKTTLSAIVAVESAFTGALGGPELEERCVFVGGLRVAIVGCVWEIVSMGSSCSGATACRFMQFVSGLEQP